MQRGCFDRVGSWNAHGIANESTERVDWSSTRPGQRRHFRASWSSVCGRTAKEREVPRLVSYGCERMRQVRELLDEIRATLQSRSLD